MALPKDGSSRSLSGHAHGSAVSHGLQSTTWAWTPRCTVRVMNASPSVGGRYARESLPELWSARIQSGPLCSRCGTRAELRKTISLRRGSLLVLGLLFVVGVSTSSTFTFKTKPTGGAPTQPQTGSGPETNRHAAAPTPAVASPGTITRSEALAKTKITNFTWQPIDTLMKTTFTIHNDADIPVRDIEIKCTDSAPSGHYYCPQHSDSLRDHRR